ncbi:MAG: hypothetical protein ACYC1F_12010 [Gallionellaceae bacterium]
MNPRKAGIDKLQCALSPCPYHIKFTLGVNPACSIRFAVRYFFAVISLNDFGGVMPKFDFSVTTRDGQKVESVQIYGKDLPDAERKLRQMYYNCEVTQSRIINPEKEFSQSADIEDVLSLIVRQN